MSRPLRVVIADDSPFMVRTLMLHLKSDPGFEVVGTALNGPRAVELVRQLRPDIVTLDVDMPDWKDSGSAASQSGEAGLQALYAIMQEAPVPVVMVSGVSHSAAATTLRAIEGGAVDFVLKYTPGVDTDPAVFRRELLTRMRSAAGTTVGRETSMNAVVPVPEDLARSAARLSECGLQPDRIPQPDRTDRTASALPAQSTARMKSVDESGRIAAGNSSGSQSRSDSHSTEISPTESLRSTKHNSHSAIDRLYRQVMKTGQERPAADADASPTWSPAADSHDIRLIVIGASTGGPTALRELLGELPADFPVPIVVVQHMPAAFTGVLAAQLDRRLALRVREAWDGDTLQPGRVFIAPGEHHVLVNADLTIQLSDALPVCGHRPSVNVSMQSAAEHFGSQAIGVLLTGMGEDGAIGMLSLHQSGAMTFAQSADTCVVNGMPQRAVDRGAVQYLQSPATIGRSLHQFVTEGALPDTGGVPDCVTGRSSDLVPVV